MFLCRDVTSPPVDEVSSTESTSDHVTIAGIKESGSRERQDTHNILLWPVVESRLTKRIRPQILPRQHTRVKPINERDELLYIIRFQSGNRPSHVNSSVQCVCFSDDRAVGIPSSVSGKWVVSVRWVVATGIASSVSVKWDVATVPVCHFHGAPVALDYVTMSGVVETVLGKL